MTFTFISTGRRRARRVNLAASGAMVAILGCRPPQPTVQAPSVVTSPAPARDSVCYARADRARRGDPPSLRSLALESDCPPERWDLAAPGIARLLRTVSTDSAAVALSWFALQGDSAVMSALVDVTVDTSIPAPTRLAAGVQVASLVQRWEHPGREEWSYPDPAGPADCAMVRAAGEIRFAPSIVREISDPAMLQGRRPDDGLKARWASITNAWRGDPDAPIEFRRLAWGCRPDGSRR